MKGSRPLMFLGLSVSLVVALKYFETTAEASSDTKKSDVSAQARVAVPALGVCTGRGGVRDVDFWGPMGETCNGIDAWGAYGAAQLCPCTGHGSVEGVQLWGPRGVACGGFRTPWTVYGGSDGAGCVAMSEKRICACKGHGDKLEGQLLWGPEGLACGGMPNAAWGTYSESCRVLPSVGH
jgi:hypothetical protein